MLHKNIKTYFLQIVKKVNNYHSKSLILGRKLNLENIHLKVRKKPSGKSNLILISFKKTSSYFTIIISLTRLQLLQNILTDKKVYCHTMDTIHENEMKKTNINSKLKNIPSKAVSLCRKN